MLEYHEKNILDFEDALQYEVNSKIKCDYIITRNKDDFKDIPAAITPAELLLLLKQK